MENIVDIKAIKHCMVDKDVTQNEVGKVLHLTSSGISDKFTGRRHFTITELVTLADYFGVDINIFLNKEFSKREQNAI